MVIKRLLKEHVTKRLLTVFGNLLLLFKFTMVLKAEYKGKVTGFESTLCDGLDHILCRQFVDDGVTMRDDGVVLSVPKVQLDATTSGQQNLVLIMNRLLTDQKSVLNVKSRVRDRIFMNVLG